VKAVVYKEPFKVDIEEVEDAKIQDPTDVLIRVTSTAICGSDLHMYEGRTGAPYNMVFGHENQGIIEEVGEGVSSLSVGDRINLPFNVACGFCANCEAGKTGFCLTANDKDFAGAAYGYVNMGPYTGGQAEYLRVPWADFNALRLPGEENDEFENDFITLSDILPTGWHATVLAGVEPGNTVAIWGAGPVGLMAAYSAYTKGAERVFMVDHNADRLQLSEDIGCISVNFDEVDPPEFIVDQTEGNGVDCSIDGVGYQATAPSGEEQPAIVLNQCVASTRATGRIGVVGLYVPEDPGAPTEDAANGRLLFQIGKFFEKGLSMGTGQANVKRYNRALRDMIVSGRMKPSFVVSKDVPLEEAPDAYHRFDNREDGYTKVVLKP